MAQSGTTHAFIVRVWQEPRELATSSSPWRGVVEHVPGGERRYLADPGEIVGFVVGYTGPWTPAGARTPPPGD